MSIRIDKEFESLIPPLSDDEFKQLEENCLRDGIRDPLILWSLPNGDNILVDGHNRWKIAAKHGGMSFTTKCMKFDDRDEAIIWIVDNQLGRRNLHTLDRVTLEDKKREIIARIAKRKQKAGKADPDKKSCQGISNKEKNKIDRQNKTDFKIAKAAGTSEDTVRKVRRINEAAPESVKKAVREGKLSINQAFNSTFPKRPDPVKVAKEEHEQFKQNKDKITDFRDAKIDQVNQKIINNAMTQDVLKLIDCITKFGLEYGPIKLESWAASIDDDTATHTAGMIKNCHMILKNITDAIDGR